MFVTTNLRNYWTDFDMKQGLLVPWINTYKCQDLYVWMLLNHVKPADRIQVEFVMKVFYILYAYISIYFLSRKMPMKPRGISSF